MEDKEINELLGISENYQASSKLTEILKDKDKREQLFERFLAKESDLSYDWFLEYYQEQSDRKSKKQDLTPGSIAELVSRLLGQTTANLDIAAGSGGLTIKRWNKNPDAFFYAEELSDQAFPFLIFNLAIRNVNAIAFHGDSLTRKFKEIYRLTRTDHFSEIEKVGTCESMNAQTVSMNPPYSLKWNPAETDLTGALPPKSKADYAFVLQGLRRLSNNGMMAIILPHGVLFRGSGERDVRKELIDQNLLDAVIGLPGKVFIGTDIPTLVMIIKKNRKNKNILFIDAQKEFTKGKNHNLIEAKHIDKIVQAYHDREEVKRFSHLADIDEIKENDYNLNIPRYVDTFVPEPEISLVKVMQDIYDTDLEIDRNERELDKMFDDLVGATPGAQLELDEFRAFWSDHIKHRHRPGTPMKPTKRGEQLSLL